ncbi:hypothetical protein [Halomonas sp. YLGW01]|uniref:hypothetical protein n=1 Tax=Halomonas sp. YLGW01 TaxID=2773308 RepID=UPI00177D74F7|nr:hypothetical protein [Halomonas sp. YLGW01]
MSAYAISNNNPWQLTSLFTPSLPTPIGLGLACLVLLVAVPHQGLFLIDPTLIALLGVGCAVICREVRHRGLLCPFCPIFAEELLQLTLASLGTLMVLALLL